MNHLAFDGVIEVAPKFRRRKELEHRLPWFTKSEVEAMAQVANDLWGRPDIAHVVLFASYTALRQGEVLSVRALDVDLTERRGSSL